MELTEDQALLAKQRNGECVEVRDLKLHFQGVHGEEIRAVDGLSFCMYPGEIFCLLGHNGAGKSSIFRCLGGLWTIPTGSITKPGSAESGLDQEVFYLPRGSHLNPWLSRLCHSPHAR